MSRTRSSLVEDPLELDKLEALETGLLSLPSSTDFRPKLAAIAHTDQEPHLHLRRISYVA